MNFLEIAQARQSCRAYDEARAVEPEKLEAILEAARSAGIEIPTLCYLKDLNQIGACRLCVVDTGARALQAACVLPVSEGMVVKTNTPAVRAARKSVLELILSNHKRECLSCVRSQNCELQKLSKELGVDENRFAGTNIEYPLDNFSPSIVRDPNKCILCGNCVRTCSEIQGIGVLGFAHRGTEAMVMPAFNRELAETNCVSCGQCRVVCPTGALTIRNCMESVWQALGDPNTRVVAQIAPAVRVAVGVSVGYTRSMTVTQEGNAVKLTFHPAYGFINGKIGAKNTFDIPLKPYQDKIYIFPSGHGLIRNEQGQWERQTFNIES